MLTKGYNSEDKKEIQRLECNDSQRTIGARISPSGDQEQEYNFKIGQTKNFAVHMRGSHLSRSEAAKAYKTVHQPMITYSLGVTTLSHRQLTTIQSIAEAASLPKLGFNRKFPKRVLRGPH